MPNNKNRIAILNGAITPKPVATGDLQLCKQLSIHPALTPDQPSDGGVADPRLHGEITHRRDYASSLHFSQHRLDVARELDSHRHSGIDLREIKVNERLPLSETCNVSGVNYSLSTWHTPDLMGVER